MKTGVYIGPYLRVTVGRGNEAKALCRDIAAEFAGELFLTNENEAGTANDFAYYIPAAKVNGITRELYDLHTELDPIEVSEGSQEIEKRCYKEYVGPLTSWLGQGRVLNSLRWGTVCYDSTQIGRAMVSREPKS